MPYKIGQVLFVVTPERTILPLLVVEEITKKTLSGKQLTYVFQLGPTLDSGELRTVSSDKLNGEIFESAEEIKKVLYDRAKKSIDQLVSVAQQKSKKWFLKQEQESPQRPPSVAPPPEQEEINLENGDDSQLIKLPDGTIARIKT